MINPPFPTTAASLHSGAPRRGRSAEKIFCRSFPRNPLISLDSDERIQGNPRESNSPELGFSRRIGQRQENPCMDAPVRARCFANGWSRDRVRSCIRPPMRLLHAAGRYGDARTRRRSIRRAVSSLGFIAFPGPDLTDHLPLPFVDLLTRPTFPWLHSPIVDQRAAAAGTR
jgi:hypothetical protein